MPTYAYRARDLNGRLVTGIVLMPSEQAVREHLRGKNLFVTRVVVRSERQATGRFAFAPRVRPSELVIFSREFAGLIQAGIPILEALDVLVEQTESPGLRTALEGVRSDVIRGASLSAALRGWPSVFPEVFVALVVAGEATGELDRCLEAAAVQFASDQELREKVKAAFTYPTVVLITAAIVVAIMLTFVVPVFDRIYSSMNCTLPLPTRLLVSTSRGLTSHVPLVGAALVAATFLTRACFRTERGRLALDQVKLWLPVLGKLGRKIAVARFLHALAGLIRGGVPLTRSLEIASAVTGNRVIARAVRGVIAEIAKGSSIAVPIARTGQFPPVVARMIAVGERSGALDRMLVEMAAFYDREVEFTVRRLTTLLEPLLTAILAMIVGGLVLSLYLPIFSLAKIR